MDLMTQVFLGGAPAIAATVSRIERKSEGAIKRFRCRRVMNREKEGGSPRGRHQVLIILIPPRGRYQILIILSISRGRRCHHVKNREEKDSEDGGP